MDQIVDTPKIKWINPNRALGKATCSLFRTEAMLQDFLKHRLITEITGNYSLDVYDMCRNGATWLGIKMHQLGLPVEMVEGTFQGSSHCWVVMENCYFDMTIAQSDPSYPKFAIVYASKAEGYSEFMRFTPEKWVQANC